MKILVINGPNLNMLGKRDKEIYGEKTLSEIDSLMKKQGETLNDYIQEQSRLADGVIINPGALTHYGFSLRDALADTKLPVIEVHLSNVYAREEWRAKSVIAPIATGQISGLAWRGYVAALRTLVSGLKGENWE